MEPANFIRSWRSAVACLGALGVAVTASAPASAHHSFAMFDQQKTVKVEGTVTEVDIMNPHSWLRITAPSPSGKSAAVWSIEMGGPHQVEEMGLKVKSTNPSEVIKPGEKITVFIHPLRSGSPGGSFVSALMADGREFKQGARPEAISKAIAAGQN
jgi:hypothetical protein